MGNTRCNSGKHPACFPLMSGTDFNSTLQCKEGKPVVTVSESLTLYLASCLFIYSVLIDLSQGKLVRLCGLLPLIAEI